MAGVCAKAAGARLGSAGGQCTPWAWEVTSVERDIPHTESHGGLHTVTGNLALHSRTAEGAEVVVPVELVDGPL
jgi:hypothetical protein